MPLTTDCTASLPVGEEEMEVVVEEVVEEEMEEEMEEMAASRTSATGTKSLTNFWMEKWWAASISRFVRFLRFSMSAKDRKYKSWTSRNFFSCSLLLEGEWAVDDSSVALADAAEEKRRGVTILPFKLRREAAFERKKNICKTEEMR
jgi:hypothetical protein